MAVLITFFVVVLVLAVYLIVRRMRITFTCLLIFLVILFLSSGIFIIKEGAQVVLTQFGKVVGNSYTKAGIYVKMPFIWKANYFERRIMTSENNNASITTEDGFYVKVDVVAFWEITDPKAFISNLDDTEKAKIYTNNIIDGAIRQAISKYTLKEVVRSDLIKQHKDLRGDVGDKLVAFNHAISIGRGQICDAATKDANNYMKEYGVRIRQVLIKDIRYEPSVETMIYKRMAMQQLIKAAKLRSEGKSEAQKIQGKIQKKLQMILAPAEKQALLIKGTAEALATKTYAQSFGRDPHFYNFWAKLKAYKKGLPAESQGLILSTDSSFLDLLKNRNAIKKSIAAPKIMHQQGRK